MVSTPGLKKHSLSDKTSKEPIMISIPGLQKNSYGDKASKEEEVIMITTPDLQEKKKQKEKQLQR